MYSKAALVGALFVRLRSLGLGRAPLAGGALFGASWLLGEWLRGLLARTHINTAVVALAAKMARIIWAVLRSGRPFQMEAMPSTG